MPDPRARSVRVRGRRIGRARSRRAGEVVIDGLDYLAAVALELVAYRRDDHDPGDEDRT